MLFSSTESVHIVGLEGELKSNRLGLDTTFSQDVESIGENIHEWHSSDSWHCRCYCRCLWLSTDLICLSVCPVYFEDTLLAVWRHGWQRRRQGFTEVLEETTNPRKIHRLVQSNKYGLSLLSARMLMSTFQIHGHKVNTFLDWWRC